MTTKAIVIALLLLTIAMPVLAQATVEGEATAKKAIGDRILSKDGSWSIPVASNVLGSDSALHNKRDSEMTYGAFDISAPLESPVYSPCTDEGEVIHTSKANEGGYGYNVQVQCNTGLVIWIGHLSAIWTKSGSKVGNHTIIGKVGRTGQTSFNHVHITLRNPKGYDVSTDIESHFDLSLFYWEPFANPEGEAWEHSGRFTNAPNPWDHVLPEEQSAGDTPQSLIILSAITYVALTAIIHTLSRSYQPIGRRFALLGSAHILCITFIFFGALARPSVSMQNPKQAVAKVLPSDPSEDYDIVIEFVLNWENWKCTHDPVRTMGGITNVTYQAWLKRQGRTYADVCDHLTKAERNTILKDLYWEPIAADEDWPLNTAIFDAQIGSGQGMAARLLRSNKTFEEYQEARKVFYREMNRPQSYIDAWLRRTDELTELVSERK